MNRQIEFAIREKDIDLFKTHFDDIHRGNAKGRVSDILFQLVHIPFLSWASTSGYEFAMQAIDHIASYPTYKNKKFNWSNIPKMILENVHSDRAYIYGDLQQMTMEKLKNSFTHFDINAAYSDKKFTTLMLTAAALSPPANALTHLMKLGADANIESNGHGRAIHFVSNFDLDLVPKMQVLIVADKNPAEEVRYLKYLEGADNPFYRKRYLESDNEKAKRTFSSTPQELDFMLDAFSDLAATDASRARMAERMRMVKRMISDECAVREAMKEDGYLVETRRSVRM